MTRRLRRSRETRNPSLPQIPRRSLIDRRISLWRNSRFQFLWTSAVGTSLSEALSKFALPLLLLSLTGDAGLAGVVTAAMVIGRLAAQMPAGMIVDRGDRRRVFLSALVIRLVASGGLLFALLEDRTHLAVFLAFAIVDGVAQAFAHPVRDVAIRLLVPASQLRAAFAQEEARSHAAGLLGPSIGGIAYGVSQLMPFIGHTVFSGIALVLGICARVPRRPEHEGGANSAAPPRRSNPFTEAFAGFAWLLGKPGLREMIVIIMAMNLLGGMFSIPLLVHLRSQGADAEVIGVVLAGVGIGGLIGALLSASVTNRLPVGLIGAGVPGLMGLCFVLSGLPLGPWWPMAPVIVFSVVTPWINVLVSALIAELVPVRMLGRLGAVVTLLGGGLAPLGPLFGGILAGAVGGGTTLMVSGFGLVLVGGLAFASPTLRKFNG